MNRVLEQVLDYQIKKQNISRKMIFSDSNFPCLLILALISTISSSSVSNSFIETVYSIVNWFSYWLFFSTILSCKEDHEKWKVSLLDCISSGLFGINVYWWHLLNCWLDCVQWPFLLIFAIFFQIWSESPFLNKFSRHYGHLILRIKQTRFNIISVTIWHKSLRFFF